MGWGVPPSIRNSGCFRFSLFASIIRNCSTGIFSGLKLFSESTLGASGGNFLDGHFLYSVNCDRDSANSVLFFSFNTNCLKLGISTFLDYPKPAPFSNSAKLSFIYETVLPRSSFNYYILFFEVFLDAM